MTTEVFTESEAPVMPIPLGAAEAVGWVVRATTKEGVVLQGVVRGKSFEKIEVQWDGECPRSCCLDTVKMEQVEFVGLVPCDCGSGTPEVLCLCDEFEVE